MKSYLNLLLMSLGVLSAQSQLIIDRPAEQNTDVVHISADLSFNWSNQTMEGKASLQVTTPLKSLDTVVLDAQAMVIKSVTWNKSKVSFVYQNNQLKIPFANKALSLYDTVDIQIVYVAQPELIQSEGSAAITDEKGLYFINAQGANHHEMRHLWTQGEVKSNSVWMPCVDEPNDKITHEFFIHTPKEYVALSNGLLKEVKEEADEKVFHWIMDQPHSPYLMMMAVGPFKIVQDKWNDLDVDYYVEAEWEKYAKDIFGSTPEMLTFFSEKLNYPYPWKKYAQAVVREYVSGAMENTTATIHGDFLYRTKQELVDEHNELIIAHELFHHWFGDLVTCESWGNLPLNESFANYSEYLWLEYKYGKNAAEYHSLEEADGYFYEYNQGKQVTLIRKSYATPNDMFDAHSYNKGGRILNMLRNLVGDDAFFAALNTYLTVNAYQNANYSDLQIAFEKHTDQNIKQFFKQWFHNEGHPILDFKYTAGKDGVKLQINQEKALSDGSYYHLPLKIGFYSKSKGWIYENIEITKKTNKFKFKTYSDIGYVLIDADANYILSEINNDLSINELMELYTLTDNFVWKYRFLDELIGKDYKSIKEFAKQNIGKSSFYALDLQFLDLLETYLEDESVAKTLAAQMRHENPEVRAYAIDLLGETQYKDIYTKDLVDVVSSDSSIMTISSALNVINSLDPSKALALLSSLEDVDGNSIMPIILKVKAVNNRPDVIEYSNLCYKHLKSYDVLEITNTMVDYMLSEPRWEEFEPYSQTLISNIAETDVFYIKMTYYSNLFVVFEQYKELAEISAKEDEINKVNKVLEDLRSLILSEKDPKVRKNLGLDN